MDNQLNIGSTVALHSSPTETAVVSSFIGYAYGTKEPKYIVGLDRPLNGSRVWATSDLALTAT